MKIEIMLYVYLFVCFSMIIFNIVTAILFRINKQKTERVSRDLKVRVMLQLKAVEANISVSQNHKLYLNRKLKRVGNMIAFDKMLEAEYIDHPYEIREYLRCLDSVFVSLMAHYSKKNRIEAAYFPYIIKKYRLIFNRSFPSIEGSLMQMLNEPSIYCRENAMQALYTTGNSDCIIEAIKIIDCSNFFFHGKLLCDGLLNFSGKLSELSTKIIDSFFEFSNEMKVTLLDFLRFSSDKYKEFALSLLKDENANEEVRYACIRYLGKYRFWDAYNILCRLATESSDKNWQYAAIACTALSSYPNDNTVKLLKQNLYSRNWYVRLNSAISLKNLGITYSDLTDIIDGHDRFASEVIRYCLQLDNEEERVVARA